MKKILDLLKGKATGWVATVIACVSLAVVVFTGGTTKQTFTGVDGSVYEVDMTIPAGVVELIDACDLKAEGQTCPVGININVILKKKGTGKGTPEPVKPVEVKPVEEVKETPKVEETKEVVKVEEVKKEAEAVNTEVKNDKPELPETVKVPVK